MPTLVCFLALIQTFQNSSTSLSLKQTLLIILFLSMKFNKVLAVMTNIKYAPTKTSQNILSGNGCKKIGRVWNEIVLPFWVLAKKEAV